MTFIGGAPQPPAGTLINGDFSQPQLSTNSYIYINTYILIYSRHWFQKLSFEILSKLPSEILHLY
jgi:hypothetical protein